MGPSLPPLQAPSLEARWSAGAPQTPPFDNKGSRDQTPNQIPSTAPAALRPGRLPAPLADLGLQVPAVSLAEPLACHTDTEEQGGWSWGPAWLQRHSRPILLSPLLPQPSPRVEA